MATHTWTKDYALLLPPSWERKIDEWLDEDIPSFDYGGFVVGNKLDNATLWCKESGVFAGKPFVDRIFSRLHCTVTWNVAEGDWIDASKGKVAAATVTGSACALLQGERTALNLIARASGIATRARVVANKAKEANWHGSVAGTRKTTPGFRWVEKYALLVGGCDQHRYDLSSMIMLKDNHVWSSGSITAAVKRAKSVGGFALKIEVECQSEDEANEAITAGADIVMLDNFTPEKLKPVAKSLKERHGKHIIIEASGGVLVENVQEYFDAHVDVISMGLLTQSVPHIDFSLKIHKS